MQGGLKISDAAGFSMERHRHLKTPAGFKGRWQVECVGADGKVRWTEDVPNGPTTQGLNHVLDAAFHAGTQITAWFVGLITAGGSVALGDQWGGSGHAGWTEFKTYSGTNRPAWNEGAPAAGVITSSTTSDFTISSPGGTVMGICLVSQQANNVAESGTLWATALFASNQAVSNGDVLKVTYTITATGS